MYEWKKRYESELSKPPRKNNLKLVTISSDNSNQDDNNNSNTKKLDENKINDITNKAFEYYLQECDIKNDIRNKKKKSTKRKIKNYIIEINDNFNNSNIETFDLGEEIK